MDGGVLQWLVAAAREVTMFAAVGLFVGGLDDLLVDALYVAGRVRRSFNGASTRRLDQIAASVSRFAILVPAWDESPVIGAMLRTMVDRLDGDFTIYVGVYPNDPATIAVVSAIAADDGRVRLVTGRRDGPTTKADCLNTLWRALCSDEQRMNAAVDAVILHDAEDVVHRGELAVFDEYLRHADAVQLPVLPLARPGAHMVGGTYLDEFAESHGKAIVVRQAIGASLPLAGVGCAIKRSLLGRIAEARGGLPFDAASLTEDYELGLTIAQFGGRTRFARVPETAGGQPVSVRAYFPATLDAAVRQKTRWMIGIALAGWDRTGWTGWRDVGEHWMRMRDRRTPLAALVVLAAYASLVLWVGAFAATAFGAPLPAPPEPMLALLLVVNGAFLIWRLAMRASFVGRRYGSVEALLSMPRMLAGNIVAMMAARRAVMRYAAMMRGAPPSWDKTAHQFPNAADLAP